MASGSPPSFTCPRCGRVSYHPDDVAAGYCGACHDWTGACPACFRPRGGTCRCDWNRSGSGVPAARPS